ncbi:MAG: hypothetical protein WC651_00305 [Candidatus Gracilibacteria bacterium]|jgi:hypothetical protein
MDKQTGRRFPENLSPDLKKLLETLKPLPVTKEGRDILLRTKTLEDLPVLCLRTAHLTMGDNTRWGEARHNISTALGLVGNRYLTNPIIDMAIERAYEKFGFVDYEKIFGELAVIRSEYGESRENPTTVLAKETARRSRRALSQ